MSEWISVDDRLPGDLMDGKAVIVATTTCSGELISETDAWNKHKKEFDFWGLRVTHWQPLPPTPSATK